MKKSPKKNDISIMETNKNNRNTFSRRKMISLKELFFMKKKKLLLILLFKKLNKMNLLFKVIIIYFSKKRNNSSNNVLNNNIISEFNLINKRMKVNEINRIGISLNNIIHKLLLYFHIHLL